MFFKDFFVKYKKIGITYKCDDIYQKIFNIIKIFVTFVSSINNYLFFVFAYVNVFLVFYII